MHSTSLRSIALAAVLSLATAIPSHVYAAETNSAGSGSPWTAAATLYVWGAGLDGDVGVGRLPTADVNMDFGDILSKTDFAGMGIFEIRRGKIGFFGELLYIKMSDDVKGPAGYISAEPDVSSFTGLAAGSYRVAEDNWGNVDIVGGVRVFDLSNELTLSSSNPALPTLRAKESETWADAVGGAKMRYNINDNWFLNAWAMAGAGGSDFTWDLLGAAGYQFNSTWSVSAGYRALGVDYENDGFRYDVVQSGPVLGVTARF
ncbi:MAG: hypothetical protein U1E36_09295 [Rickettsiales bacterium]